MYCAARWAISLLVLLVSSGSVGVFRDILLWFLVVSKPEDISANSWSLSIMSMWELYGVIAYWRRLGRMNPQNIVVKVTITFIPLISSIHYDVRSWRRNGNQTMESKLSLSDFGSFLELILTIFLARLYKQTFLYTVGRRWLHLVKTVNMYLFKNTKA